MLNIDIFDAMFRFRLNFVSHAAPNLIVPLNEHFVCLLFRADVKFPNRCNQEIIYLKLSIESKWEKI